MESATAYLVLFVVVGRSDGVAACGATKVQRTKLRRLAPIVCVSVV